MDTEDLYQKLLNSAFRFVSYRPRSEKEFRDFLHKKLLKRRVDDTDLLEKVLERMRQLDYINDTRFISWWIEQRTTHRPKGMRLMRQELIGKGVSKNLIDQVIAEKIGYKGPDRELESHFLSEQTLAKRAVAKKLVLWRNLPSLARKKKLYDFLARRGFDSETIFRVIDELTGKGYNASDD